jgi:hypothetical protein
MMANVNFKVGFWFAFMCLDKNESSLYGYGHNSCEDSEVIAFYQTPGLQTIFVMRGDYKRT